MQSFAQLEALSDMERSLENVVNTVERCSLYYQIGDLYFHDWQLEKAILNYHSALVLAIKNKDVIMESRCLSSISSSYLDASLPDSSLLFCNMALEAIAEDSSKIGWEEKSSIHYQFGLILDVGKSAFKKALAHFILSLEYAEKAKNPIKEIDAYLGLTLIYSRFEHEKCVRYGEIGLQKAQQQKIAFMVAEFQRTMGHSYLRSITTTKELEKGKVLLLNSMKFHENNETRFELADVSLSLAKYFLLTNQLDSSVYYTTKSRNLFRSINAEAAAISADLDLAKVLGKKGKYEKAIQILKQYQHYSKIKLSPELKEALQKTLYECYAEAGHYEKAFHALKRYKTIADSFFIKKWDKESSALRIKYDSDWLEKERQLLSQKNEVLHTSNYLYLWLSILLLLLLVAIFWSYRKVKLKNSLIRTQRNELEILNTNKDRFFGIIAHDLRSPMISMEGLAQKFNYLLQRNRTADIRRLGFVVESALTEVHKLIDNLLNWALIEQQRFPHKPQIVNVNEMVTDVIKSYERTAEAKNIALSIAIPQNLDIYVDKYAITAVIRNFTDNAIKFTHPKGKVHLSARQENEYIIISVEDTGIGIPDDLMEKLFLLEGQGGNMGTKGEKGSGLGLVLCKELVEKNKGQIEIKSTEGDGSIFSILLPSEK